MGVQPSFQNLLKTFLGWKKWFPCGLAKPEKTYVFVTSFQLASFLGGLARFQHITSQRLKNWLSPRIRVKLREKDLFHKKTQPSLLVPFWGQKPQKVSNQVFFLKPTMQLSIWTCKNIAHHSTWSKDVQSFWLATSDMMAGSVASPTKGVSGEERMVLDYPNYFLFRYSSLFLRYLILSQRCCEHLLFLGGGLRDCHILPLKKWQFHEPEVILCRALCWGKIRHSRSCRGKSL